MHRTSDIGKLSHLLKNVSYYQYLKSKILGVSKCGEKCGNMCTRGAVFDNEGKGTSPQRATHAKPIAKNEPKTHTASSKPRRLSPEFKKILQDNDDLMRKQNIFRVMNRLQPLPSKKRKSRSRSRSRSRARNIQHNYNNETTLIQKLQNSIRRTLSGSELDVYATKYAAKHTPKPGQERELAIAAAMATATRCHKSHYDAGMPSTMQALKTNERYTRAGLPNPKKSTRQEKRNRFVERLNDLCTQVQTANGKCLNPTLLEKIMRALGPPDDSYAANWPPFLQPPGTNRNDIHVEKCIFDLADRVHRRDVTQTQKPITESKLQHPNDGGIYLRKSKSALAMLINTIEQKKKHTTRNDRKELLRTRCTRINCGKTVDSKHSKLLRFKNQRKKSIHEIWVNPRAKELNYSDTVAYRQPAERQKRRQHKRELKAKFYKQIKLSKGRLNTVGVGNDCNDCSKQQHFLCKLPANLLKAHEMVLEHEKAIERHRSHKATPTRNAHEGGKQQQQQQQPPFVNNANSCNIAKQKYERDIYNEAKQKQERDILKVYKEQYKSEVYNKQIEQVKMDLRSKNNHYHMHEQQLPITLHVPSVEAACKDIEEPQLRPQDVFEQTPDWQDCANDEATKHKPRIYNVQNAHKHNEPEQCKQPKIEMPWYNSCSGSEVKNTKLDEAWRNAVKYIERQRHREMDTVHNSKEKRDKHSQTRRRQPEHKKSINLTQYQVNLLPITDTYNTKDKINEQDMSNATLVSDTNADNRERELRFYMTNKERWQQQIQQQWYQQQKLYHQHNQQQQAQKQHCQQHQHEQQQQRPHYKLGQNEPPQKSKRQTFHRENDYYFKK